MKKTIKLALAAAMAMGATSAFATNGDNLIGVGAKSRAMGGTGMANFMGAESTLHNPSLLAKMKGSEFTFGGTYFQPSVEVTSTPDAVAGTALGTTEKSDARHNVIPDVALAMELGDGITFGIGMWGTAGMGVDFRDNGIVLGEAPDGLGGFQAGTSVPYGMGLYRMKSSLQLMKFAPSIAYGEDNWGVGVAAVIQYGNLAMSFAGPSPDGFLPTWNAPGGPYPSFSEDYHGQGASDDLGLGYQIGAFVNATDDLTVAVNYTSKIDMEYKNQISYIASQFGYNNPGQAYFDDHLEQPAEYGLGVAYNMGDLTVTGDIKRTEWNDAKGYGNFGWDSVNTYAIGTEYRMDDLALRAGFNYAKSPLHAQGDTRLNLLNFVMFPATVERHVTVGAGYQFSKQVSMDLALGYALPQKTTVAGTGMGLGTVETIHKQYSASVGLNLNF